jgi:hypothetical protein
MEWKWLRRVATYLKAGEKDTSRLGLGEIKGEEL